MLKEGGTRLELHSTFLITKEMCKICFLKQHLHAFKLIQHRFKLDSKCFNKVEMGANDFNIPVQWMLTL